MFYVRSAAGHVGSGTVGLEAPLWQPLLAVSIGGLVGGIGVVLLGRRLLIGLDLASGERYLHVAFLFVGGFLVSPLFRDLSTTVLTGILVGLTFGTLVTRRSTPPQATSIATTGGVFAHRAVEGLALASIYLTGSAIGFAGIVVIVVHTAVETAAVYVSQVRISRRSAWVSVLAIQAIPVVTGVGGTFLGLMSTTLQQGITAIAGSSLIAIAYRELRTTSRPPTDN